MTIQSVKTTRSKYREIDLEIRPDGNDAVEIRLADEEGDVALASIPESDWRRLCRESCGEPRREWIEGPPKEPGRYVIKIDYEQVPRFVTVRILHSVYLYTDDGMVSQSCVVRHFSVPPDPPEPPKPVPPVPPVPVRVRNSATNDRGYGMRERLLGTWAVIRDDGEPDLWSGNIVEVID